MQTFTDGVRRRVAFTTQRRRSGEESLGMILAANRGRLTFWAAHLMTTKRHAVTETCAPSNVTQVIFLVSRPVFTATQRPHSPAAPRPSHSPEASGARIHRSWTSRTRTPSTHPHPPPKTLLVHLLRYTIRGEQNTVSWLVRQTWGFVSKSASPHPKHLLMPDVKLGQFTHFVASSSYKLLFFSPTLFLSFDFIISI